MGSEIEDERNHYPEEWTDVNGVKHLTCACGSELPCPLFVPGGQAHSLKQAMDWAVDQTFQSVAATYARVLAVELIEIQKMYPNWFGKFSDLADAIKRHTAAQDQVIFSLRGQNDLLRKRTKELEDALRDIHGTISAGASYADEAGVLGMIDRLLKEG